MIVQKKRVNKSPSTKVNFPIEQLIMQSRDEKYDSAKLIPCSVYTYFTTSLQYVVGYPPEIRNSPAWKPGCVPYPTSVVD